VKELDRIVKELEAGEEKAFVLPEATRAISVSVTGDYGVYLRVDGEGAVIGGDDTHFVPPEGSLDFENWPEEISMVSEGVTTVEVVAYGLPATDKARKRIKHDLGSPPLELAIKNIDEVIHRAFEELQPDILEYRYVTLPFSNVIDMSDYKPDLVIDVYRTQMAGAGVDLYDPFYIPLFTGFHPPDGSLEDMMYFLLRQQILHTLKDRLSYRLVGDHLYIDLSPPKPNYVTVVYSPRLDSFEDLQDKEWVRLVFRLALAYTKQIEGRIRSKFRVQNSPVELDGSDLRSEGQDEEQKVREDVEDMIYTFFPE